MRTVFLILNGLILLFLPSAGHTAKLAHQPGIIGKDDRLIVPASKRAWWAIGQINVAGFSRRSGCSGTLVGPRTVITAAHCLMHKRTKRPARLKNIHFVAGFHKGKYKAHRKAKCIAIHPRFAHFWKKGKVLFSKDIAVIKLNRPVRNVRPIPLSFDMKLAERDLIHASYPANRRHVLSAHEGCFVAEEKRGIWQTNCDTNFGSSGGPALVRTKRGMKTVGVMVGARSNLYTIVVPLHRFKAFISSNQCR